MFPRPIVITTLEEDFKKIGILVEKTETAPEVEAEVKPVAEEDEEYIEGQENMTADELEEARVKRRVGRKGRTAKATKRTPPRLKMKSRRNYRKKKAKIKLARKKAKRNPRKARRAKVLAVRRARLHQGNDTISNLIEEVQDIVSSLNGGQEDAVKSFANIAIIADMLANTFTEWTNDINESEEELEEGDETLDILATSATELADLAEAAAEIASGLKAGSNLDIDGGVTLEELFREYMSSMLEGMDLYNEATKKTETDDSDEDDADGDSDKEEDDDEDEDDDKEEAKEMPAFIKKKIAAKDGEDDDDDGEDDDAEESVKGDKEDSLKKKK